MFNVGIDAEGKVDMIRTRFAYICGPLFLAVLLGVAVPVTADTIDPTAFAATVPVGGSTTVRKTVVVEEAVTSGVIDVVFLFDTSGSMGPFIDAAHDAAEDILAGLSGFGDLATATGFYSEPGNDGTVAALTTNAVQGAADINAITLGLGGGGGDFPEEGVAGTFDASENTAWRAGSNRFIIALGDATFKESDGATVAGTLTSLDDNNVTFIGIDFANMTRDDFGGIDPTVFATATGGGIFPGTADPDDIVDAIVAAIEDAFAEYNEVTVSDLGGGLPGVDVDVVCVSAAPGGVCSGASATGTWTREEDRTFEFDVTFTGLVPGVHGFPTHALVDGGIVASEDDRITVGEGVPEPSLLSLLALAAGGALYRRRSRRQ
jgi:hypothetical protein